MVREANGGVWAANGGESATNTELSPVSQAANVSIGIQSGPLIGVQKGPLWRDGSWPEAV